VPLVVELSNDTRGWFQVARRDEVFYDWRPEFAYRYLARYVRLRVARATELQLTRVEIR
jgi:hypothetical protein